jgi:hypothetical protein
VDKAVFFLELLELELLLVVMALFFWSVLVSQPLVVSAL